MSFAAINGLKDRLAIGFDRIVGRVPSSYGNLNGHSVKVQSNQDVAVGRINQGHVVPGTRFGQSYRSNYYSVVTPTRIRPLTAVSGLALGITLAIFAIALVILGMS